MSYQSMEHEHLVYWLERAKAEVNERDLLIQNQRNEIERLTRSLQEVTYNSSMQNAIIAYEVQRFAVASAAQLMLPSASTVAPPTLSSAACSSSSSALVPTAVVRLSDLEAFLQQLTGGILAPTVAAGVPSPQQTNVGGSSPLSQGSPEPQGGGYNSVNPSFSPAGDANNAPTSLSRRDQIHQRYSSKRCRDQLLAAAGNGVGAGVGGEAYHEINDGRPLKPGQWSFQQQDVQ